MFPEQSPLGKELTYIQFRFVPAIAIFVVGLFLGQTFTSMFDMVIDTLFFCFICDEEMYTGKQRYAEPELRELMDMYGKEAKRADDDLDIRARPKQFKEGEDENSLIDDNIFVTEHPKEKEDKNKKEEDEDDHGDPNYKVLHLDDGASHISDNALSVSGITARSRLDNQNDGKKDDGELLGFRGINFGQHHDESDDDQTNITGLKSNAVRNEWNSNVHNHGNGDDEEEESEEEESGEDEEEEDDEEEGGVQQQQNTANFEGGENGEEQQNKNKGLIDTTMFKSNKNPKIHSEDSEEEEDLEANNITNPITKFKPQNFLF